MTVEVTTAAAAVLEVDAAGRTDVVLAVGLDACFDDAQAATRALTASTHPIARELAARLRACVEPVE